LLFLSLEIAEWRDGNENENEKVLDSSYVVDCKVLLVVTWKEGRVTCSL